MDSTLGITEGTGVNHIALVGNPNCGKTSLFNLLSGLNQHVANFAGVTVESTSTFLKSKGKPTVKLTDLPGVTSLYPQSEDERVTSQILLDPDQPEHPDKIVVVVDATQLRRGLALCTQVMDLGFPTVLVLNMMDLVEREKLEIDLKRLQHWLKIPVFGISALTGTGLKQLKEIIRQPVEPPSQAWMEVPRGFRTSVEEIGAEGHFQSHYHAYMALISPESFPHLANPVLETAREHVQLEAENSRRLISNEWLVRLDRVDGILEESVRSLQSDPLSLTEKIDRILVHKVWGYLIFLGVLLLIFQAIFAWATYPMDLIEAGIGAIGEGIVSLLPEAWYADLINDGIIAGLAGILVFIPQIAFLFLFIAIMEESGYMSRVVFLMDRVMRPFGFSGKSIIPLMGGMACAIPSIMMARNIPSRTERLITILVTPLMSCSARIPVYTLLIAMFVPANRIFGFDQRGLIMTGLYILGFVAALLMAWVFKRIFRYDSKAMFLLEMPSYRKPRWRNVGITVWHKVKDFIWEAGKIIFVISIILWVLAYLGPDAKRQPVQDRFAPLLAQADLGEAEQAELEREYQSALMETSYAASIGKFIEPAIEPLGYDWKIGISIVASFAAREVFVGTMSVIYAQEDPDSLEEDQQDRGRLSLIEKLQAETDSEGRKIYDLATVLSLLIFYAFAMQCVSTLAVTRKEAGWLWVGVMVGYLTVLAYVSAWLTYVVVSAWM